MRVVFLGSPPFATPILRRLLESHHEVLGLVTPPDRPRGRGRAVVRGELAALADDAGLPVLQPASTRDPAFVEALAARGVIVDFRPEAGIRVSLHFHTEADELRAFAEHLDELRRTGA